MLHAGHRCPRRPARRGPENSRNRPCPRVPRCRIQRPRLRGRGGHHRRFAQGRQRRHHPVQRRGRRAGHGPRRRVPGRRPDRPQKQRQPASGRGCRHPLQRESPPLPACCADRLGGHRNVQLFAAGLCLPLQQRSPYGQGNARRRGQEHLRQVPSPAFRNAEHPAADGHRPSARPRTLFRRGVDLSAQHGPAAGVQERADRGGHHPRQPLLGDPSGLLRQRDRAGRHHRQLEPQ